MRTKVALERAVKQLGSLSRVSQATGIPIGSLSDVLHGRASRRMENRAREALLLPLLPEPPAPCPTCGEYHNLNDCQGAKVQHVRRKKANQTIQSMSKRELAYAIRNRRDA